MALEEQIIEWSKDRPRWQREVMRRTAAGNPLSEKDYDILLANILTNKAEPEVTFGLEHLSTATADDPPVRIVSIANLEHVNALTSDQPLTFEANGLTIVYGDNGSGKSGYARLLKRITRARHQEDVLTDVFRDTSREKSTAKLTVLIGDKDESINWPESTPPQLKHMLFYDGACGNAYIAAESDFPYRPSALIVMDGLINACVAVRSRIDAKLDENTKSASTLPIVVEELKDTDAGRYVNQISATSSIETIDELIKKFDESSETIEELKEEEGRLRSADTTKERQFLTRQAEKLDAVRKHIEKTHATLGDGALTALKECRDQIKGLEEATNLMTRSFESEPLPGVGTSPWKELWDSARRFSVEHAYPMQVFPVVDDDCRCVLCHQPLDMGGRDRFSRFEAFVRDDTQVRLDETRRIYDVQVDSSTKMVVSPDAVEGNLKDLEAMHAALVAEILALLGEYEKARVQTRDALTAARSIPLFGVEAAPTLTRITQAAQSAREMAEGLANPLIVQQRLAATTAKRQELEILQQIKNSREVIIKEIARRKERELLEDAKTSAATGPITKKVLELSEESITEVVRNTFTRETDRLRLERVTIAKTRADKGALFHQPKLVGARQEVKLPRVFSEGERTALGLAAFFTEAHMDASRSGLILDDPVTSLDHIRRGLVAVRLAELAESRQIVLFTHDVAFVADLKREAAARGVSVAERSVTRSRAGERKPGACTTKHPWKAKDVPARLDELRQELGRIKRDCGMWDDKQYEEAAAVWAGNMSETWERIFSQEIVGPILTEGGLEVRPMMVRILARFSDDDYREFEASYSRVSQWAKRHDKSATLNYVAPEVDILVEELDLVDAWFKRIRAYKL